LPVCTCGAANLPFGFLRAYWRGAMMLSFCKQLANQGGTMFSMSKSLQLAGMVVALATGAEAMAADATKDLAALQAVDQRWLKAYTASDADTLASLYDEQAVLLPPGAPSASGRAAIRVFLGKDAAESAKAGVVLGMGAKPAGGVSGNMGWQSGTYTVKDKTGKIVDSGKYLSVSVKKDGQWLYVRDTWNSDGPPAAAASAAAPKK
jgi:uncharacterized protein (TIGR02246 family)